MVSMYIILTPVTSAPTSLPQERIADDDDYDEEEDDNDNDNDGFSLGATPNSVHGLLLALWSEFTPSGLGYLI